MSMRVSLLISLCAIAMSACARDAEIGPSTDEFTVPSASDAIRSPGKSLDVPGRAITGVLGFDDIEGGCSFVETADGVRYEVTYPEGWELDRLSGELRGPDGVLVRAGEEVTVRGSVATDRSSICQIGPIFLATEVEIGRR
jgi:hypothetical protein